MVLALSGQTVFDFELIYSNNIKNGSASTLPTRGIRPNGRSYTKIRIFNSFYIASVFYAKEDLNSALIYNNLLFLSSIISPNSESIRAKIGEFH